MALSIPISKVSDDVDLPEYAHASDGAVDLYSQLDITLQPFERALIPCGIKIAIPIGYAGLVIPRSGLAIRHGISVVNGPGLIDSGYRGEICVVLINLDPHAPYNIRKHDRIAQLMIVSSEQINWEPVEALSESDRDNGGFGSSGR